MCQWKAGECRGLPDECMGVGAVPGECNGVDVICQGNAGEFQGNIWKWFQSAKGMQGNARGMKGGGCKVPGECRRMQGNARGKGESSICQGNAGECQVNVWKLIQRARGMRGECIGMCTKCQGNAWECMGLSAKCQRNAGE